MSTKTIRTWVYALLKYKNKILVIKKWRWPFKWLYDLPWGKIEHSEENIVSLKREIIEEVWIENKDFEIKKLFLVTEDFVKHIWKWEEKDEHIIAIVYLVEILNDNIDLNYIEENGDAKWLKLIELDDEKIPKTNILKKVLRKYKESWL
jgi:8-oxo-dGTP pyrophosphatase MutT (NUDIX family)